VDLSGRWARIEAIRCCPSYNTVTELCHHKNAQLIDLVSQRIKIRFDLGDITLNLATLNASLIIIRKLNTDLFELLIESEI